MTVLTNLKKTASDLLDQCSQQAEQRYVAMYGQPPQWIVTAPGRVNLIGEHTDYNDGFVLPMAIDQYVVIAAASNEQSRNRVASFHSANLEDTFEVSLSESIEPGSVHWSSYIKGVIAGFSEHGGSLPSFNAVIQSSVASGSGLSSSAALEVATATLLEAILNISLDPEKKALLCQQAEHRFAGVPCGIMDQFSSVFGREDALMLLDCRSQQIQSVPFVSSDVTVLITNSNVKHRLADGEYAKRRQQCETATKALGVSSLRDATLVGLEKMCDQMDQVIFQRARHVITENTRTLEAAAAIGEENWIATGELMYASHDSLRDDYEVSCDELNILVGLAQEIGVDGGMFGSRLTGGGFGGCTVSLVKTESVAAVSERLRSGYLEHTGIEPSIFSSRPSRGAHVIRG